jgi:hypothetical protein
MRVNARAKYEYTESYEQYAQSYAQFFLPQSVHILLLYTCPANALTYMHMHDESMKSPLQVLQKNTRKQEYLGHIRMHARMKQKMPRAPVKMVMNAVPQKAQFIKRLAKRLAHAPVRTRLRVRL